MHHTLSLPLGILAVAALFAGDASADDKATPIGSLPDKGTVTLSGSVQKVDSEREFTLQDNTGSIDVSLTSGQSVVLKPGDKVSVTGTVNNRLFGLMGKSIDASSVNVHKDLASVLSNAVTDATGISLDKAQPRQISNLSDQGIVKLTGTVDNVVNAKNFTLRDNTGKIDVSIQSSDNVLLTKGAGVTVIGYINHDALGKSIHATHVFLTADSTPAGNTSAHAGAM
jgi:uncharacterized protein YdeI (BOF family)